ncbi:MvdC/MvdD family ATP grasp protein [Deinococcus ruber]|uniref:MvdD-like pre-ATP grasp domain-containing protein n=1 Tax=Deinococcus ruber TaxID=1848197 RepID=A0A918C7T6_9DEIO|nr:hypothetical protein [Deinococcus ruber]GGR10176.1 hypothetical protein GCM10008957_23740 [Deinococcus ruber]
MKNKSIVVYTSQFDLTADIIISRIQLCGHDVTRINTEDLALNTQIEAQYDENKFEFSISNNINLRNIVSNQITSVWWRKPNEIHHPAHFSEDEKKFANREFNSLMHGLWSTLDCYWVDHPLRMRAADYKVEQLERARKFGFNIPDTVITANPSKAREFLRSHRNEIIYKTLSNPLVQTGEYNEEKVLTKDHLVAKTTLITCNNEDVLDSVSFVPCLLQELIHKKYELRITVIGDEVFAAEIHSQEREETKLDWRDYSVTIPYKKASLSEDFEARCLNFVKSYGLNYSALDFIVTPDDTYIFLENNPGGQFLFIEERVPELLMADAMTRCLIEGKTPSNGSRKI